MSGYEINKIKLVFELATKSSQLLGSNYIDRKFVPKLATATGNIQPPRVSSRVGPTIRASVDAERRK